MRYDAVTLVLLSLAFEARLNIYGFSQAKLTDTTVFGRLYYGPSRSKRGLQHVRKPLCPELHVFGAFGFDHDSGFRLSARITQNHTARVSQCLCRFLQRLRDFSEGLERGFCAHLHV